MRGYAGPRLSRLVSSRRLPLPRKVAPVLLDTLRADRLGAYGSGSGLTPVLDTFASSATLFRKDCAQGPWTNPSVASLFTSRYRSQYGVTSFGSALDDREQTLAEQLSARRYEPAVFVANILLQEQNGMRALGYARAIPSERRRTSIETLPRWQIFAAS